jgi:hypothetical protein
MEKKKLKYTRKAKVQFHWRNHEDALRISVPVPTEFFKFGEKVLVTVQKKK